MQSTNTKTAIKWGANILIPIMILLCPMTENFTSEIRNFFALTIFAIILIATENIPIFTTSILLPMSYMILLQLPSHVVFKAWSLEVPWLILGGFIITIALKKTGLLERIAYASILMCGGSIRGILYGLMILGAILSLVIADVVAKAILICTLAVGICDSMNIKLGSKSSSAIGLAVIASTIGTNTLYLISTGNLVVLNIIKEAGFLIPTYSDYMLHRFLPQVVFVILTVVIIDIFFRPDKQEQSKDFFENKLKDLGKLSNNEIKIIAISVLAIVLIATSSIHGVSAGWLILFAASITMFPLIKLVSAEDIKLVNFTPIFFVVACLTIGIVSVPMGVGKFIADAVYPYIANSATQMFAGVWGLGFITNFALTPLAAYSTFTLPIIEMSTKAGINHLPIIYTFIQSLEQIILPYEYAPVLVIFGYGLIPLSDFIKFNAMRAFLSLICVFALFIPYWKMIGLM